MDSMNNNINLKIIINTKKMMMKTINRWTTSNDNKIKI